ncbi:MAG TPA: hypothetical protein RMF84_07080 [Polyangiaceae bacterium LLY-WYZ-14_1]|nr:hypothetical protein [Polyangiaceae bacterium LLY-WYZ-14_1]
MGAPFLVAVAACLCLAGACGRTGLASPELPHRDAGSPDPPPAPGAIAPSRCGLRQPVDLDGDGVPLVQETVVPLPVGSHLPEGAGGRPMAGTLSAGGGSTLLVTDCLRPVSDASEEGATCGPGVVLVDETGVLGTPIPRRAYGLVFAPPVADVATPPDGTSWLMLPAARPASEADFGFLWSLWSFRCGEATVIVDAASTTSRGRPRLLAVHPTGALLVAPGADDGVEAMSIDPEGNRREIVQTPDRLLSWTVVSGEGAFFRVARPPSSSSPSSTRTRGRSSTTGGSPSAASRCSSAMVGCERPSPSPGDPRCGWSASPRERRRGRCSTAWTSPPA